MKQKFVDLLILLSIFSAKLNLNNKALLYINKADEIDHGNRLILELKLFILLKSEKIEECTKMIEERIHFSSKNIEYIRLNIGLRRENRYSKENLKEYLRQIPVDNSISEKATSA